MDYNQKRGLNLMVEMQQIQFRKMEDFNSENSFPKSYSLSLTFVAFFWFMDE
jgi:hypothetical protein